MNTETFTVVRRGVLWTIHATPESAMLAADKIVGDVVDVRSNKTSDGSTWPSGRGRLVATREYGEWRRF